MVYYNGVFSLCQHFEISYSRNANKHITTGVYITINNKCYLFSIHVHAYVQTMGPGDVHVEICSDRVIETLLLNINMWLLINELILINL
jgi:hypothetical protein